jgi:hypothetical protein
MRVWSEPSIKLQEIINALWIEFPAIDSPGSRTFEISLDPKYNFLMISLIKLQNA